MSDGRPRTGRGIWLSAAAATLVGLAFLSAGAADLDNTKVRSSETAFGNLLTDALRAVTEAEVGFLNGGAMREKTVPGGGEGAASLTDLLVYPTEKVAVLSLTGEQVTKALERSLSALPTPSNGFLQVSGLKVVFDPAAASGRRVKSALLLKSGRPLEPDATYRVATSLDLAKGGQGYFAVFGRDALVETPGVTIRAALEQYLAKRPTQAPPKLDRLVPAT